MEKETIPAEAAEEEIAREETAVSQTAEPEATEEQVRSVQAQRTYANKKNAKEVFKNYFSATRIAYIAVFTALSLALRFLQFVILPSTPVSFLKFDFSDVFVLIGGYALGPVAGSVILVLKEVFYGVIHGSSSMYVGELANILTTLPMLLITSVLYKKHKGIKSVLIFMAVASLVRVACSFPINWLLNFPAFCAFDWNKGMDMFMLNWHWVTLFNLIKTAILAVVTLLVYKPLSSLVKLTNEKFDNLKKKKKA